MLTRGDVTPGSIPVHTGKPGIIYIYCPRSMVYPRTHGETLSRDWTVPGYYGLSPYTRGNPVRPQTDHILRGSIPVHTGKPVHKSFEGKAEEVYPRTHGETETIRAVGITEKGLSPYTRGNRADNRPRHLQVGSIPVHTGKPQSQLDLVCVEMVYPRTHGETSRMEMPRIFCQGLSPYTRGNLCVHFFHQVNIWSIPVHTGKPCRRRGHRWGYWVYPRTHGETCETPLRNVKRYGLSPYTRGNPTTHTGMIQSSGSIPVHTGKPFFGG